MNHHALSMILSENRFALFRIMKTTRRDADDPACSRTVVERSSCPCDILIAVIVAISGTVGTLTSQHGR
jgi:hypothetical protein